MSIITLLYFVTGIIAAENRACLLAICKALAHTRAFLGMQQGNEPRRLIFQHIQVAEEDDTV
jgi:hypothetical protein